MIVYVVLNSKFKDYLLQSLRGIARLFGCKDCCKEEYQNNEKEVEIDLVTQKSVSEIAQQSPSYLHRQRDKRSPVFV